MVTAYTVNPHLSGPLLYAESLPKVGNIRQARMDCIITHDTFLIL